MTLFDFLQLMGGVLLALGYVPQIIQIKTTHSCKDLNLKTYATIFVGICLMEVYAINLWMNGSGYMFLITNTVSLVIVYYICMLILMEQVFLSSKIVTLLSKIFLKNSAFIPRSA